MPAPPAPQGGEPAPGLPRPRARGPRPASPAPHRAEHRPGAEGKDWPPGPSKPSLEEGRGNCHRGDGNSLPATALRAAANRLSTTVTALGPLRHGHPLPPPRPPPAHARAARSPPGPSPRRAFRGARRLSAARAGAAGGPRRWRLPASRRGGVGRVPPPGAGERRRRRRAARYVAGRRCGLLPPALPHAAPVPGPAAAGAPRPLRGAAGARLPSAAPAGLAPCRLAAVGRPLACGPRARPAALAGLRGAELAAGRPPGEEEEASPSPSFLGSAEETGAVCLSRRTCARRSPDLRHRDVRVPLSSVAPICSFLLFILSVMV
ncbi:proline-rich protein 2-like [Struthio camelus]|uniref:proline-rich protein 2-like n=1 Tax=Struthio camelus TaxID=8801 RepID=UPI0036042993